MVHKDEQSMSAFRSLQSSREDSMYSNEHTKQSVIKQNKTMSIITARGEEDFRKETATNRIKRCGDIQKDKTYEDPTGFGA